MTVGVYTTLSPTHVLGDEQQRCLRSWMDAGYHTTCVQAYSDTVDVPKGARRVDVEPSKGYRRPYIYLDSLVHQALEDGVDYAIITNSDIELRDPSGILKGYLGDYMTIANRIDYKGDHKGQVYPFGFDLFIIPRSFLEKIPKSLFVIGQTWWDYWLPYIAIKSGLPLRMAKEPILWHREHPQQHDSNEWERMTELFVWMEQVHKGRKPHDVTRMVYQQIKAACR